MVLNLNFLEEIKTNPYQSLQNLMLMSTANMMGVNKNCTTNVLYEGKDLKPLSPTLTLPLALQDMNQEKKEVDYDKIIVDNKITKEISKTVDQEENLLSISDSNENISVYIPPPPPLPPPPPVFSSF